jgi:hypothetical protein
MSFANPAHLVLAESRFIFCHLKSPYAFNSADPEVCKI